MQKDQTQIDQPTQFLEKIIFSNVNCKQGYLAFENGESWNSPKLELIFLWLVLFFVLQIEYVYN